MKTIKVGWNGKEISVTDVLDRLSVAEFGCIPEWIEAGPDTRLLRPDSRTDPTGGLYTVSFGLLTDFRNWDGEKAWGYRWASQDIYDAVVEILPTYTFPYSVPELSQEDADQLVAFNTLGKLATGRDILFVHDPFRALPDNGKKLRLYQSNPRTQLAERPFYMYERTGKYMSYKTTFKSFEQVKNFCERSIWSF